MTSKTIIYCFFKFGIFSKFFPKKKLFEKKNFEKILEMVLLQRKKRRKASRKGQKSVRKGSEKTPKSVEKASETCRKSVEKVSEKREKSVEKV